MSEDNKTKMRASKSDCDEFVDWYIEKDPQLKMNVNNIIDEYERLTNVKLSKQYVSSIRKMIRFHNDMCAKEKLRELQKQVKQLSGTNQ